MVAGTEVVHVIVALLLVGITCTFETMMLVLAVVVLVLPDPPLGVVVPVDVAVLVPLRLVNAALAVIWLVPPKAVTMFPDVLVAGVVLEVLLAVLTEGTSSDTEKPPLWFAAK